MTPSKQVASPISGGSLGARTAVTKKGYGQKQLCPWGQEHGPSFHLLALSKGWSTVCRKGARATATRKQILPVFKQGTTHGSSGTCTRKLGGCYCTARTCPPSPTFCTQAPKRGKRLCLGGFGGSVFRVSVLSSPLPVVWSHMVVVIQKRAQGAKSGSMLWVGGRRQSNKHLRLRPCESLYQAPKALAVQLHPFLQRLPLPLPAWRLIEDTMERDSGPFSCQYP